MRTSILSSNIFKSLSWNSLGNGVYFLCLWLITVLAVRLSHDFEDVGNLMLAMTVTNVFACVALYNIRSFQVSDISGEYPDSVYIGSRLVSCVLSLVFTAAFVVLIGYSNTQSRIILIYMLFRAIEAFIDVLHGIFQKEWRMDYVGISLSVRGVLMLIAFVVLFRLQNLDLAVLGMLVSTVAVGIFYDFNKARKLVGISMDFGSQAVALLKRCFPLMLVLLINVFIMSYPRYVLERVMGADALGVYGALAAPAQVINIAGFIVLVPLINVFASYAEQGNIAKCIKLVILCCVAILAATIIASAVSLFAGEWGLALLFGSVTGGFSYLLPGIVVTFGLFVLLLLFNIVYTSFRDIRGIMYGNIIGAFICLVSSGFFVSRFGLMGVNYVLIISMTVSLIYLIFRLRVTFSRLPHQKQ